MWSYTLLVHSREDFVVAVTTRLPYNLPVNIFGSIIVVQIFKKINAPVCVVVTTTGIIDVFRCCSMLPHASNVTQMLTRFSASSTTSDSSTT